MNNKNKFEWINGEGGGEGRETNEWEWMVDEMGIVIRVNDKQTRHDGNQRRRTKGRPVGFTGNCIFIVSMWPLRGLSTCRLHLLAFSYNRSCHFRFTIE